MHRLTLVALTLTSGIALNVGVAWLCALYSRNLTFNSQRPVTFAPSFWQRHVPQQWRHLPHTYAAQDSTFGYTCSILLRSYDHTPLETEALTVFDFGWPVRSLRRFDFTATSENPPSIQSATWTLPPPYRRSLGILRFQLPLAIIPLGFLANSAFYAAFSSAPFFIVRSYIRFHRRRRGICPICRYPIGASTKCPECGHSLPTPAVA